MKKKTRGENGGKDMRGERVNEDRQVESIAQTGEKRRRCFSDSLILPRKNREQRRIKMRWRREPAVGEGLG